MADECGLAWPVSISLYDVHMCAKGPDHEHEPDDRDHRCICGEVLRTPRTP